MCRYWTQDVTQCAVSPGWAQGHARGHLLRSEVWSGSWWSTQQHHFTWSTTPTTSWSLQKYFICKTNSSSFMVDLNLIWVLTPTARWYWWDLTWYSEWESGCYCWPQHPDSTVFSARVGSGLTGAHMNCACNIWQAAPCCHAQSWLKVPVSLA